MSYLKDNVVHHNKTFGSGYGILYPEGHIIRVYEKILRHEVGLSRQENIKLLDFGCGNGTHCEYFLSKGYEIYGADANSTAIEQCQKRMPELTSHFQIIDPEPSKKRVFFGGNFNVILANQVLIYFSDIYLDNCIQSLFNQLCSDGIFIASMIGTQHYLFKNSQKVENGLYKVETSGNVESVSYINFCASKEELIERFRLFKPLHVGYYDFQISEDEGNCFHYLFVGKKEEKG